MAGRNTGYTHRHWSTAATDIRDGLQNVLVPALEHMRAGLHRVTAGDTQQAKAGEFVVMVSELADRGTKILAAHDQRLRDVSEAQRQAGGVTEVAGDKRYNRH